MKYLLVSVLILLAISVGGYYYYTYYTTQKPTKTSTITKISVSPKWVNQAQFAGIFVAIEKGFYNRYGLDVTVNEFNENSNPTQDVVSGKSQFAIVSANEALSAFAEGKPIKALAAFYQNSSIVVVSLKDHKATSPRDFKGLTLGVKGGPGSETDLVYDILLKAGALSKNDIKLKYLPFGTTEYQDLVDNRADAMALYRTDQLYFFDKKSAPYNIIYPEQCGSSIYNDVLISTNGFIQSNPGATKLFIRATIEGWDYAFAHPDESVELILKHVTQKNYQDKDYEKYILTQSKPLVQPDSNIPIGSMNKKRWEKNYENLRNLKIIKDGLNINDLYTTDFLP